MPTMLTRLGTRLSGRALCLTLNVCTGDALFARAQTAALAEPLSSQMACGSTPHMSVTATWGDSPATSSSLRGPSPTVDELSEPRLPFRMTCARSAFLMAH